MADKDKAQGDFGEHSIEWLPGSRTVRKEDLDTVNPLPFGVDDGGDIDEKKTEKKSGKNDPE